MATGAAIVKRSLPVGDVGLVQNERRARAGEGVPSIATPPPAVRLADPLPPPPVLSRPLGGTAVSLPPVDVPSIAPGPPQMKLPAPATSPGIDPSAAPTLGKRPPVVVGDNDKGAAVSYTAVKPSFCTGSTLDEIERAYKGDQSAFKYDPARQKDASNPAQCEAKRLQDLASGKLYRESPESLLKNIGAGLVNGIIPGADLGDARSSTQVLGQLIAAPASIAVGGASGLISSSAKNMGTIGNIISKANTFLTSPLGQIGQSVVGSLIPKNQPMVSAPGMQIGVSPIVPDATFLPGWGIKVGTTTKGPSAPTPINQPAGTVNTGVKSAEIPSWVYLVGAALVALMLLKRRGRG